MGLEDFAKKTIPLSVIAVCSTAIIILLFVALWQFKELLGLTLVILLVVTVVVFLAGTVNEQFIRHRRFAYQKEMPMNNPAPMVKSPPPYGPNAAYPFQGDVNTTGSYGSMAPPYQGSYQYYQQDKVY